MTDPATEQFVLDLWQDSLRAAYLAAKGERMGELRGNRARLLDARGIHQFSESWGVIRACEDMIPTLMTSAICTTPAQMKKQAAADAYDEFVAELREPVAA